jgi:hypothetical protein
MDRSFDMHDRMDVANPTFEEMAQPLREKLALVTGLDRLW